MISYLLQVWFESDVIPDSGKTRTQEQLQSAEFESDVIPDSGKTSKSVSKGNSSLRVM